MPAPERDPAVSGPAPKPDDGDRALLHDAVRAAGALALDYHGSALSVRTKDDNSPVSEADLAVDALLRDRLFGARPAYGWLSEETEDDPSRLSARATWIVDPIDGTRSFVAGGDEWCVSAALAIDGHPVLGAVYNPLREAFYSAERGGGAMLNAVPIRASDRTELAGARMLGPADMFRSKRWADPWPELSVTTSRSIALRLCLVADGGYDATIALSPKSDWDLAAGHLIVEEAGGRMSGLEGGGFVYNRADIRHPGLVASGAPLHSELVERTRHFRWKHPRP
mgnify:CR=1 FL=1